MKGMIKAMYVINLPTFLKIQSIVIRDIHLYFQITFFKGGGGESKPYPIFFQHKFHENGNNMMTA